MEKYTMFMDRKNQYSENEYTTQSNLQIQCNPYQAINGIFERTKTNNFTICMEIQKNPRIAKASFNFMAAVTICSDFGAQENKF